MRNAILGAGGVGGLVGGVLAKAGHPVTLLVQLGRRGHYPERIVVESKTLRTFEASVRVVDRLDGQFDIFCIAVKAAALNEACAVALAEGAKVTPEPILAALEEAPDGFRSSMQKDVAAGRPPELDAIAGPILGGSSEHGIDVLAARALVDRIVALE